MKNKILALLLASSMVGIAANEISAGPACRGIKRKACIARPACRWVKRHKRGTRTIKGHCRAKVGAKIRRKAK